MIVDPVSARQIHFTQERGLAPACENIWYRARDATNGRSLVGAIAIDPRLPKPFDGKPVAAPQHNVRAKLCAIQVIVDVDVIVRTTSKVRRQLVAQLDPPKTSQHSQPVIPGAADVDFRAVQTRAVILDDGTSTKIDQGSGEKLRRTRRG